MSVGLTGGEVGAEGGWQLTHANVVLAAVTPDVIWHLKSTQTENSLSATIHWVFPWSPHLKIRPQLHCKGHAHGEDKE